MFLNLSHEVVSTLIVCVVCLILYIATLLVVRQIFANKSKHITSIISGVIGYLLLFVGIIVILKMWKIDLYPFLVAAGIVMVIVGLSLQEVLRDVVNGIKIITTNTFAEGDVIEVCGFRGEVSSITLLSTVIVGSNKEVKTISNRLLKEVINYSKNLIVGYVDLYIEIDEDIEKVLSIISGNINHIIDDYPQIIEGPNVLGLISLKNNQTLRITFKAKVENISLIERNLRKELIKICINNNIKISSRKDEIND